MKRFVREDIGLIAAVTLATLLVVAATGAGAAGTYLIALGFVAIAIAWQRVHETPPNL